LITVVDAETHTEFRISTAVRLTSVKSSLVRHDRLAVFGPAGRTSAVVVLDLAEKRLADWFFCTEPTPVSANWIAYVEWYPRFWTPREVVLLYDLDKTPAENRLPTAARLPVPAPLDNAPVQVGIPVYPQSNVQEGSYRNVVEGRGSSDTILVNLSFLLLQAERLVFVAAQGRDYSDSRDFLVSVDLSRGLERPVIRSFDIPKAQLQKLGENPDFIQITALEALSDDSVRLVIPRSEYGMSSLVVDLPR
jgi:hypothetical protein